MPNPYPTIWQFLDTLGTRLEGELTFTDPSNQPGGGSGTVDSVTAGDSSITIAGTVANPTVAVADLGITAAKIQLLAITDAQVAAANKDGASGTPSMRTLGTGAAQATAGNDPRLSDARTPTGAAGGDLTGTYPNPTLATAGGGAAGPIGSATVVPIVTVDAKGRVTALSATTISGVAPAGTAGGDLSGTYPNPATAKLNGVAITNAPALGQVLTATDATHAAWAAGGSGDGFTTLTLSTDQTYTSTTTPAAITDLSVSLTSGGVYLIQAVLVYASPLGVGTPDLKWFLAEDSVTRGVVTWSGLSAGDTATVAAVPVNSGITVTNGTQAGQRATFVQGWYISGGGTLGVSASQNTSSANPTIVYTGSQLRYKLIV